jgi:L-lactate dehydrogenase complex protein LldG
LSSREAILDAVRQAAPAPLPLPAIDLGGRGPRARQELLQEFIDAAEASGASVVRTSAGSAAAACKRVYPDAGRRVSALVAESGDVANATRQSFANTDVFICSAVFGVAENGAVWLPISRLRYRSALFLATDVIVLLDASALVPDFHAAYESIALASEAFGVFVAGPSKTADIEQALVVGAHGPKAVTIVLIEDGP